MWFIIKGAFWFSLVLIALSVFDPRAESEAEAASGISMGESLSAAATAIQDIRGICVRHPEVCEKGGRTIAALGVRAREGARFAYQLLDEQFASDPAPSEVGVPGAGMTAEAPAAMPADMGAVAPDAAIHTGSLPEAQPAGEIPVPTFIR